MRAGLRRDRRGGVGLVAAAMMPVLVGFAAFAVDLGAVQLDTRRLQGIADAAAIAAASTPTGGLARAQAVVNESGFPRGVTVILANGAYSPNAALPPASRFVAGAPNPNATQVRLESNSPTFFARVFGTRDVTISRVATARRERLAAFSVGSRLASLDGGILNSYLSALTGSDVKLSVMDYNALAGADIDLLRYLPVLRTTANLDAVTFNDILTTQVATPKLLDAVAATLTGQNQASAGAAASALARLSGGASVSLSTLIDAGVLGGLSEGGTGIAKVNTLAMVTAILQISSPKRQVALDLGATIPGLAKTTVVLAVGERAQQSPWVTITDKGTPIVRTAQARLYVRAQLLPVPLPILGPLVSINLPILLELASAEGRLSAIDCAAGATRSVTLEGRTNPGTASIGTVDESRIGDFSSALVPSTAKLVDVTLGEVTGSSRVSIGNVEPWQSVRFTETEIANGTRKTIASSTPVGGIASSLVGQAKLKVTLFSFFPLPLDPIISAVGAALSLVSPALDTLLMTVTGTLGVGIGEADLQTTGMRCGQATLVA